MGGSIYILLLFIHQQLLPVPNLAPSVEEEEGEEEKPSTPQDHLIFMVHPLPFNPTVVQIRFTVLFIFFVPCTDRHLNPVPRLNANYHTHCTVAQLSISPHIHTDIPWWGSLEKLSTATGASKFTSFYSPDRQHLNYHVAGWAWRHLATVAGVQSVCCWSIDDPLA